MRRLLTKQEKEWLDRGFEAYKAGKDIRFKSQSKTIPNTAGLNLDLLVQEIESLRVISKCDCGDPECHTIRFQNYEPGYSREIITYHTEER
jgi:hypothetical protein